MKLLAYALVSLSLLGACGDDGGTNPATDANGSGGDGGGSDVDASVPAGWTKLIARNWTLGGNIHDNYQCRRIMVDHDTWIGGFQGLNPLGTHHQVLTISDGGGTQGDYPCSANSLDQKMLYASGVGTDEMLFPAGYAVHLGAGQSINLNLHLFNASDGQIGGESGVLIKEIDASSNPKEIGFMFGGTTSISIPAGATQTTSGQCTTQAWKLFALWPHMHQIATHQKVELVHGGSTSVLHDQDYAFADQKFYPMALDIPQGDTLRVTCTYHNTTASQVTFGDSSDDEMCFTGLYTYPAPANLFQCSSF